MVGEIVKPHGLRGEVVVASYSENPHRFAPGVTLIAEDGRVPQYRKIDQSRPHLGKFIVLFEGVGDRNEAEALRGTKLFVSEQEVLEPEEGAFWEHQILGLEVVDESGQLLGSITSVLAGAGQDLWEVTLEDRSFLLPAVEAFVKEVDLTEGRVRVEIPAGLMDQ